MILSEERFLLARQRLSALVALEAKLLCREFCVGYVATDAAPATLDDCAVSWNHARLIGTPFPVWAGASDNTIYMSPADNHAFRFWHDYLHVSCGLGMSLADELTVANLHIEHVASRWGKDSPEAALMAVDTAGQALYYMVHGEHVPNQLGFARAHFGLGVS